MGVFSEHSVVACVKIIVLLLFDRYKNKSTCTVQRESVRVFIRIHPTLQSTRHEDRNGDRRAVRQTESRTGDGQLYKTST